MSSDRCRHFIPALLHSGNDRSIQVWNGSVWSCMHDMCNVGIYTPGVSQPSLSPSPGALCTPIACYILILLIQCSPFYAHVTSLCIAFAIMTPHLPNSMSPPASLHRCIRVQLPPTPSSSLNRIILHLNTRPYRSRPSMRWKHLQIKPSALRPSSTSPPSFSPSRD